MFRKTWTRHLVWDLCILALIASLALGCRTQDAALPETESEPEPHAEAPPGSESPPPTDGVTGSIEDRRQAEAAIMSYFDALDRYDCAAMREALAAPLRDRWVPDPCTYKAEHDHFQVISMQGMVQDEPGQFRIVAEDVFTDTFMVELEVKPISPTAWNTGRNTRFVKVTREGDGRWRVSSIASSP